MGRYENFGLDEKKSSKDPDGPVGKFTCSFCWKPGLSLGFSLCFANFCICPDCVQLGLADFAAPGPMLLDQCDKCCMELQRAKKPVEKLVFTRTGYNDQLPHALNVNPGQVIYTNNMCLECLKWARTTLLKRDLNLTVKPDENGKINPEE
jgi:hypothetical protein